MKTRKLSVLVLSLAMVLTMSISVFAEVPKATNDNQKPAAANAYLNKMVRTAEGVTPTKTWSFKFTQGSTNTTNPNANPVAIGNQDITVAQDNENKEYWAGKKSFADILGSSFASAKPGEYIYTVEEVKPEGLTNGVEETTNGDVTEKITYDTNKFTVRIYVNNSGVVTNVTGQKGEPGDNNQNGKVDMTDQDPTDDNSDTNTTDPGATTSLSDGLTFVNQYEKSFTNDVDPGTDPQDPGDTSGVLNISKTVKDYDKDGNLTTASYADKTKEFGFSVTVIQPKNYSGGNAKYKILKKGTNGTLTAGTVTDATWGKAIPVNLADGEKVVFTYLPAGTKFNVQEAAAPNYKANYTIDKGIQTTNVPATDFNKELSTGETLFGDGHDGAEVAFVNGLNVDNITPTGIIINNLPYVLLIAIALGGIVLFSRKRRYE